jgi:hypothetical protein
VPTPISWDVYARDRASRTFNTVGSSAQRSGGLIGKFGATVAGVFTGAALYNGVTRLARGLADVTEAAAEDAQAASRLALQYRTSADATNSQIAASERWISKQGEVLGIADDELRPALTKLVAVTKDVGEAQDQVSVALDTAAGTGKSFNTVIDAMVKGNNGVVSGFSRMGVQTKNAAGETKTYEQITRDLAKTWGGQASTAANTAAGAYQRLKVRLSETGEEIGYKLLPYAVDWGEWALDEGIPAALDLGRAIGDELGPVVRDVANYVRENKDEWLELGRGLAGDVIPPLKTIAGIGADVAGVLGDLPGPIQAIGVQALIASRFVGGFNTSLTNGRATLQSWTTGADAAAKRTQALGNTARAAAGMAGMLLLADSTRRSSDALGILEGAAGGALMGSAAGPWGALAGGVLGGAMSAFARSTDDAADSMTEAKPPAVEYANSLNQITGAAKGATRETIRLDLQQRGAFDSAKALGISSRDLVGYLMGNEKAVRRVENAMDKATGATITFTDAFGVQHTGMVGSQRDLLKLQGILGTTATSLKRTGAEVLFNAISTKDMAQVQRQLAKEYNLTPKQVKTAVSATGVISTTEDAQRLIDKLKAIPKVTNVTVRYNEMRGPSRDPGMTGGRIGAGYGSQAGERADFVAGFAGMQSSIFGLGGGDGPLSVDSILSFGAAEQAKAEKALADMAKLRLMGLSEALIKQFAAQGASGMEVLGTLASGANAQQIGMLNAQNVATASAYGGLAETSAAGVFGSSPGYSPSGLGLPFGHGGKGGKGQGRGLSRQDVQEAMRDALLEVQTVGRLELSSDGLVATLKRERRRRGPLGLD